MRERGFYWRHLMNSRFSCSLISLEITDWRMIKLNNRWRFPTRWPTGRMGTTSSSTLSRASRSTRSRSAATSRPSSSSTPRGCLSSRYIERQHLPDGRALVTSGEMRGDPLHHPDHTQRHPRSTPTLLRSNCSSLLSCVVLLKILFDMNLNHSFITP